MTFHTSEMQINKLAERVRRVGERRPKQANAAKALVATASDRTLPVEYRRQALLRFLRHNEEVEHAGH